MAKYRYLIQGMGYGGELVLGKTNAQFVQHWQPIVEDDGDSELVEYLCDWDDEYEPEDALENPDALPTPGTEDWEWVPGNWHDLDNLEHLNTTYADSWYTVSQVDSDDEVIDGTEKQYELSECYNFYSRECYFDSDSDERPSENHIPVLSVFSSEKGQFWNVYLELDQPFDPKLFTVGVVESNLCELVCDIYYNGEPLEAEYDFADTTGKGMYAAVGWLNPQFHDTEVDAETLQWGIEDWRSELEHS